jgi:spore coat polysaccharide biosynthesis protein SpsF
MRRIPVLITVRFGSSRLPGKCLLPLGEFSVLQHCVARVIHAGMRPIVCTSLDANDDVIIREATKLGVEYFRGNLLNKIKRWSSCMEEFQLEKAHILDGDDPFFDVSEIQTQFKKFDTSGLQLMRTSQRSDSGFASLGTSITRDLANKLAGRTEVLESQNLDVIPWDLLLYASDKWSIATDNFLFPDKDVMLRLTLDYEEDYKLLSFLADKFGPYAARADIEKYLIENPEINAINETCTQAFLKNKRVQLAHNFKSKD